MRAEQLLSKLENVRKSPNGWTCRCPAHEDKQNSLSVGVGEDDKILLKCFAGCESEQIVKALNLELSDLMPEVDNRQKPIETAYNIEIGPGDIVTHLGIDYSGQHQKLNDRNRSPWACVGIIPIHDATGRKQEAFMLHLDSVRRACEHLGIDNASQLTKLKNQQWATIVLITTVAEDGKSREQSMLHLDSVPMWRVSI